MKSWPTSSELPAVPPVTEPVLDVLKVATLGGELQGWRGNMWELMDSGDDATEANNFFGDNLKGMHFISPRPDLANNC